MPPNTTTVEPKREMKVLALGLPRSGSASLAEALTILGYQNVHHGIKVMYKIQDWIIAERAADATFPVLPTYTGKAFTREQWDELFGTCEAATDVAAAFGATTARIYPTAKVIAVKRDFDTWFPSFDEALLQQAFNPVSDLVAAYVEPLIGSRALLSVRKMLLGCCHAHTVDEARRNAHEAYDSHYRDVFASRPPDQVLDFDLASGWGPLCEFLDKPVPDVAFPHINERKRVKELALVKMRYEMKLAAKAMMPWVIGAAVVGFASWKTARTVGL